MSRDLSVTLQTIIAQDTRIPIFLFELQLTTTRRFASYDRGIAWDSQTWTARDVTFDKITQSIKSPLARTSFRFDNADKHMSDIFNDENPVDKILIMRIVFLDALGSADNYIMEFKGEMSAPQFKGVWCEVSASMGPSLIKEFPPNTYCLNCQHTFGNAQCNHDGYADITSTADIHSGWKKLKDTGTGDAGSTTTVLVDADRDEADNCWKYGVLEVTSDGNIERRSISASDYSSTNVTVNNAFPWTLVGKTYTIYGGCSKTYECCGDWIRTGTATHLDGGNPKTRFRDTTKPEDNDWIKAILIWGTTAGASQITINTTSGTSAVLTVTGGASAGVDTINYAGAEAQIGGLITAINALTPRTYEAIRKTARATMLCTGLQQETWKINGTEQRETISIKEDYYEWYIIWTGGANVGQIEQISVFDAETGWFTMAGALTNNILVTDAYIIRKYMYGPSADNTNNFLGFNDIGRETII